MSLPSPRRTKIVATIGPASDSRERIESMLRAGVDVFRLTLAHGSLEDAIERMGLIRRVCADLDTGAAILADLPGRMVRAGSFGDGVVDLRTGSMITVRAGAEPSTDSMVHVSYDKLAETIVAGDRLTFGEGNVAIEITGTVGRDLSGTVISGGFVGGSPRVNFPSERLDLATPTTDLEALDRVVAAGVDMVAVSFVRTARDISALGLPRAPAGPLVVAKIETRAGVDNIEAILDAADWVLVARGDLGIQCRIAEVPRLQKRIISSAVRAGRPVIVATQMLESMISAPSPTRAEVSDVANAVYDGTSAVMLSSETAIGADPTLVIEVMNEILLEAEQTLDAASDIDGQEAPAEAASGHVFVSYSRDDQTYVNELVSHLKKASVSSWIDKDGIDYGDRWEKEIVTNLDACSVFIVVMTPSSEQSPWVMREIARAEKKDKQILPLLLKGDEFFRLSDLQYESVVGGKMPPARWVRQVKGLIG